MPRMTTLPLLIALLGWAPGVVAQTTLGELLDAGATRLSAEEFRQEVVGRTVVGPTMAGGTQEIMYARSGIVAGTGSPKRGMFMAAPINGVEGEIG